jgi:hypothetical protein
VDYQTVEQFWCKFQASNDMLSQGACWVNFENNYPPNSHKFNDLLTVGGLMH